MNVLIVNTIQLFAKDDMDELANHLEKNLIIAGHKAETLRIPFQHEPSTRLPSQMLMVRAFELQNVDHVIALKFPAYLIRHPRKTLWLSKQHDFPSDPLTSQMAAGNDIRALIKQADAESFKESRQIFVHSEMMRQHLDQYHHCHADVLIPPPFDSDACWSSIVEALVR